MVELSSGAVESLLHAWDMEERRDRHHPIHFKNTALLNYYFPPRPQRFLFLITSQWCQTGEPRAFGSTCAFGRCLGSKLVFSGLREPIVGRSV